MSAPILVIDEYNTSLETVTSAIPNLVFASVDAPSNTPNLIAFTIAPATNSFEKWLKIRVQQAAPTTLTNVQLVFSSTAPVDSTGAASLSVLFGAGAAYPTFGPTSGLSTVAVNPTLNTTVPFALANTVGATTAFLTLQLQASLGAQPGSFVFPATFFVLNYSWT